jgi:hypothetical protein
MSEKKCPMNPDLQEFLEGLLSPSEARAFENHLRDCPLCSAELEGYRSTFDRLNRFHSPRPSDRASPEVLKKIMAKLPLAPEIPWFRHILILFQENRAWQASLAFAILLPILLFFRFSADPRNSLSPLQSEPIEISALPRFSLDPSSAGEIREAASGNDFSPKGREIPLATWMNVIGPEEVKISFAGNNSLRIRPGTRFRLASDTVEISEGSVFCNLPTPGAFTVATRLGEICAVGTRFSVEANENWVKVGLEEGKLRVQTAAVTRLVSAPWQGVVSLSGIADSVAGQGSTPTATLAPASGSSNHFSPASSAKSLDDGL